MNTSTRVALYIRNNMTDKQQLIQSQLTHLRAVCSAENKVITHEFIDSRFSGSSIDRPSLKDLLLKAEERTFEEVIVASFSRLSRDVKNMVEIVRVLQTYGVSTISENPSFDSSSPVGRFALEMISAAAGIEEAAHGGA